MKKLTGLGDRIERALDNVKSQKTRADVAQAVGYWARPSGAPYTPQNLTEWIKERGEISVRAAWHLAQECGVRPAWLAFNDGPMELTQEETDLEVPADIAARRIARKAEKDREAAAVAAAATGRRRAR